MVRFIARRVATSVVLLVATSALLFLVLRFVPGNPLAAKIGGTPGITKAQIQAAERSLGLNQSILVQYWHWLLGVLHGNLGQSYFSGDNVSTLIAQRIGPTAELAAAAVVIGALLAVPAAVWSVRRQGSLIEGAVEGFATLGMGAPPFAFGIVFLIIFVAGLHVLPAGGYVSPSASVTGNLRHLLLPAVTLAIAVAAPLIRYLRASLTEALRAPYVRTARGTGASPNAVLLQHALPNAGVPALTGFGVIVGTVLGGTVAVEYVFAWPGVGSLIVSAMLERDYNVLQAAVILLVAIFIAVNLITDVLCSILDPRLLTLRGGREP